MWPVLFISLSIFGLHQLVNVNRESSAPTKADLQQRAGEIGQDAGLSSDPFYLWTDPSTLEKYKIPKLGSCKPIDGYKRIPSPAPPKIAFENDAPQGELHFDKVKYADWGISWENSPPLDVLRRLSNSKVMTLVRGEIASKLIEMGKSAKTFFNWAGVKDGATGQWPKWPINKVGQSNFSVTVYQERKMFVFQLLMKCGAYTMYMDDIHFMELHLTTNACLDGNYIFLDCKICKDPTEPCPVLLE